jgi:hypothetical protein
MSNVKFLYEGAETAAFAASDGTAVGYDIYNLANRAPNSVWKGVTGTPDQTLRVQFQAARTANTIIIDGHNIAALGFTMMSLDIERSADAVVWTAVSSTIFDAMSEGYHVDPTLVIEFDSASAIYWRVKFTSYETFSTGPEIGNIFIGTRLEPAYPYNSEVERGEKFATTIVRALDSTPYASQRIPDGIETWKNVKWGNVSDAIANGFIALNTAVRGSGRPFYFIDTDGVCRLVMVVGDTITIKPKRYDINDVQLELQAFLPNTITAI